MNRSLTGWFRHLSIGQKLLISFGLILGLLALSLTALLFYLARINSYVDRHKRITVQAIVTAANMRREAYDIIGINDTIQPRQELTVVATTDDGRQTTFTAFARLDTPLDVDYYKNGGILQSVLRNLIKQ